MKVIIKQKIAYKELICKELLKFWQNFKFRVFENNKKGVCMSLNIKLGTKISLPQKTSMIGLDRKLIINKTKFMNSNHPIASKHADTSVMLGLNAVNNQSCFMHLAPELESLCNIPKTLEKGIKTFCEKYDICLEDLTGILVGGRDHKHKDSFNLLIAMANTLDSLEIPFSMICGKFDNIANDSMIMRGRNVSIGNESLRGLKGATKEEVEAALKNNYEVVEFTDESKVKFVD